MVDKKKERGISRGTVISIVAAIVGTVLLAVIAIIVNRQEPIPDDYFQSDGTKLVLALTPEMSAFEENEEYEPEMTYLVYYYEGNEITNAKVYFEYADDAAARTADANISLNDKDWAAGRRRNGRYIVFSVKKEQYENLTKPEVEENIKSLEAVI